MQLTGRSILLKSSKDEYKSIEDFQRRHGASVVLYTLQSTYLIASALNTLIRPLPT